MELFQIEQRQQSDNNEKNSPPKSQDNSFNSDELKPYSPTCFRPVKPAETVNNTECNFELDDSTESYCNFDETNETSIHWEEFNCEGSCCNSTKSVSLNDVTSSPCSATSAYSANDYSLHDESYFTKVRYIHVKIEFFVLILRYAMPQIRYFL